MQSKVRRCPKASLKWLDKPVLLKEDVQVEDTLFLKGEKFRVADVIKSKKKVLLLVFKPDAEEFKFFPLSSRRFKKDVEAIKDENSSY